MKKLNEDVLRRLILETIDEQVLTEGKKKKKERLKEVDPVPQPSDEEGLAGDTGGPQWGTDVQPQPQDFLPNEENIMDAIKKALEIAKNKNPVVAAGARGMLKDLFKQIESSLPGESE